MKLAKCLEEWKESRNSTKKIIIDRRTIQCIIVRRRLSNSYRRIFVSSTQKIINREGVAIKRALKKYLGQRSLSDLQIWVNDFYLGLEGYVKEVMEPVIRSYAEQMFFLASGEIGVESPELSVELDEFARRYTDRYSQRHIRRSLAWLTVLMIGEELMQ